MIVRFLCQLLAFCLWAPPQQVLRAQSIAVSEAARGAPTMGPGIFMFLGFVAAIPDNVASVQRT